MDCKEKNCFSRLAGHLADYVILWIDDLKLTVIKKLSQLFSTIFSLVLAGMFAFLFLLLLTAAAAWALSLWLGSLIWGILVMAGVYLLVAVIIYARRKTLMAGPVVRALVKLFFEDDDN